MIEGNHKSDQPAHRITILPTVKIVNLLPIDLIYRIKEENGRITSGSSSALTCVSSRRNKLYTYSIFQSDQDVKS